MLALAFNGRVSVYVTTTKISCANPLVSLPFMPNEISHLHNLEQSISVLRNVGCYLLNFIKILTEHSASNQWRH